MYAGNVVAFVLVSVSVGMVPRVENITRGEFVSLTLDSALSKGHISPEVHHKTLHYIDAHQASLLEMQSRQRPTFTSSGCYSVEKRVCNGPNAGKCVSGKCNCIGGWSGLACHVSPDLRFYNPSSGSGEPNSKCEKDILEYTVNC